jgi:3-keto-5-aminohexanoate cleavage enzyme
MIKLPEDKVIITVALTGGFLGKEASLHIPIQPDEIAEAAYACYNEGATIIHMHARDKEGKPSGSVEVFSEIHSKIRTKCDVILQDSTGGGPGLTRDQRLECLDANPPPEMASLNMGSMQRTIGSMAGTVWINTRDDIEYFARRMREKGVKPEIEIYQPGMFRELKNLIDKDLLEKPYYVDLILGMAYQGAFNPSPRNLMLYIDMVPEDAVFNTLSVGPSQNQLTTMGMLLGGCIRVGLEDNLYYRKGELATNQQLTARAVRLAREVGKEPATPEEGRKILGLKTV